MGVKLGLSHYGMLEKRVMKIFGLKRQEVTGDRGYA
jgi:hypothetical protein